ncbi:Imm1 family immunity protein [Prauserella sediminis]|uniref:Imm1 family immunity protein n=1 Tax=Prauserella sediminis TaxID=577680 RepID=UPI00389AA44C
MSAEPGKGALAFGAGDSIYVPAHGTNAEDVDYQLGGAHPGGFPPKAEIPLDDMLAVLEQFLRTNQRPTGVEWVAAY